MLSPSGDVFDAILPVAAKVAGIVAAQIKAAQEDPKDAYRDALLAIIALYFSNQISIDVAKSRMTALIEQYGLQAYQDALGDAEMTDDDDAAVQKWIEEQKGFVAGFMGDLESGRSADDADAARKKLEDRADLWAASLAVLAGAAIASVQGDMMVTWQMGATLEHCAKCFDLAGQRHRLSWFTSQGYYPQEPGSETLDCHGYNCQCTLSDDQGNQVLP